MNFGTRHKRQVGQARLEHINMSVFDPKRTAAMLCRLFGWSIRWEGPSMDEGYTVHVGSASHYLALYSNLDVRKPDCTNNAPSVTLNHVAIIVDDLALIERRVISEGLTPFGFADYEPGRRFYFHDFNGVEYEVVSYVQNQPSFRVAVQKQLSMMAQNGMYRK